MPNINKAVLPPLAHPRSRPYRPRATFIGPGIYGTGGAGKLAVICKAHTVILLNWDTLAPVRIFTENYYEETKYLCNYYFDRILIILTE